MQKIVNITPPTAAQDFMSKVCDLYSTILADTPWRFENLTRTPETPSLSDNDH